METAPIFKIPARQRTTDLTTPPSHHPRVDLDKMANELMMERDRQDLATHLTEQNEKKLKEANEELAKERDELLELLEEKEGELSAVTSERDQLNTELEIQGPDMDHIVEVRRRRARGLMWIVLLILGAPPTHSLAARPPPHTDPPPDRGTCGEAARQATRRAEG